MTTSSAGEFSGRTQRNGIQPPPHVPTPSEELTLAYRTGDPSGQTDPDDGQVMTGLLPEPNPPAGELRNPRLP